jgi:hypothetical protein
MQNLWFILPIFSSLIYAVLTIIVQNNKQIPPVLIFAGKSLFLSFMILPFIFLLDFPTNPMFYIAIIIIAACNSVSGTIVYSANHKYGGGITTRILPLTTILTIFSFFIIFPDTADKLFDSGNYGLLFIACILIMCASIYFMSKSSTSFKAVMFILPACFIYALSNIVGKLAIDQSNTFSSLLLIMCFCNLAQGFFCLGFSKLSGKRKKVVKATFKFKKRYLIPLLGIAVCSLIGGLFSLYAMKVMVNPGIAMLIARATPIWVYMYNVYTGVEELDRTVIPSFIFLIFATFTILLYNIIM